MSIFNRRDRKRPAYLDTPLDEYKPRYTSLLDALEHEVSMGAQDTKALRVKLPQGVFEVFYQGGEIKHVYKWDNSFNLEKRLGLRWDNGKLAPWRNAMEGETRDGALLYTMVQGIDESDARDIFADLAIRWGVELSQGIVENTENTEQPRAEYSTHILEDAQQAGEIASWDFLQVNSYELCHFIDAYNRIGKEKAQALGITSPRDTFSLNMDEEERRGFWENSGEYTKVIVERGTGEFEIESLYAEELGMRRDMMLTALEALAFDNNVLINGAPVEFSPEEGLPILEEFATFSHGDKNNDNMGEEYVSAAARAFTAAPPAPEENPEPITEEDSAFSTQGDALEESVELNEISYTPTEMGSVKFTPILRDATALETLTADQVDALETPLISLDEAGARLIAVEQRLERLTEMYSNSSTEFNELSMRRLMEDDPMDESAPALPESTEEAETRDFADGGFFVLENLEQERAMVNGERRALMESLGETLSTMGDIPHAVLLEQLLRSALGGISNVSNAVLPTTHPGALEAEKNELDKFDNVEVRD